MASILSRVASPCPSNVTFNVFPSFSSVRTPRRFPALPVAAYSLSLTAQYWVAEEAGTGLYLIRSAHGPGKNCKRVYLGFQKNCLVGCAPQLLPGPLNPSAYLIWSLHNVL